MKWRRSIRERQRTRRGEVEEEEEKIRKKEKGGRRLEENKDSKSI